MSANNTGTTKMANVVAASMPPNTVQPIVLRFSAAAPLATQLEAWFAGNKQSAKVSTLPTQLNQLYTLQEKLIALILCKVTWSNFLEILAQTKTPEEKFFYLLHCIKEKWFMRDLRRQLSSGEAALF